MADPGRPPSYPAVVTTTTAGTAPGSGEAPPAAVATDPPRTLEEALRLYERDGDAATSLEACRRLWAAADGEEEAGKEGEEGAALSRRHNVAVLGRLAALQAERRVRRRPSSLGESVEEKEAEKGGAELGAVLSSVLTVSSEDKVASEGEQEETGEVKRDAPGNRKVSGDVNQLVGLYNVCLSQYAAGNYEQALDVTLGTFLDAMNIIHVDAEGVKLRGVKDEQVNEVSVEKRQGGASPTAYLAVATRIAFLILDCQLALYSGNGMGLCAIVGRKEGEGSQVGITAEEILAWIEKNALSLSSKGEESHEELKFRLHLYRSRVLFVGSEHGEDLEARTRTARKELKNAMDIYQNVLNVDGEGKEHGKKGKHAKHGGGKGGTVEGGSHPPHTSSKGKSHQDVSETTSVTSMAGGSLVTSASDALWSEGKGGVGVARATFEGMPHKNTPLSPPSSSAPLNAKVKKDTPDLQVRHESVLYLKANLEHLRGNPSKSLKLCHEARSAGRNSRAPERDQTERRHSGGENNEPKESGIANDAATDEQKNGLDNPSDGENQMAAAYDEAIYYNNLALLHQSAGKVHLALHYYSYALSFIGRIEQLDEATYDNNFWSDGVARPDISAEVLHNKSICAFQAQEFNEAYECMARCVRKSPNVFGKRGRCWLRLAQSCIGIATEAQQSCKPDDDSAAEIHSHFDVGSEEDLNSISANTLQRATICLRRALYLSAGNFELEVDSPTPTPTDEDIPFIKAGAVGVDLDCFETALVALAYVKLQTKDHAGAQKLCDFALRPKSQDGRDSFTMSSRQLREMAEVYSREATVQAG